MSQQVDRQQKTRPNYHQTSANGLCPERTDGWANCSPINDLNETANGRNEVNCKCDSDPPPVMGGQSVGKSKMNLIYEKLDNFYSTFKLRKKPAVNQRWLNEAPAKTCKIQRLQCFENKTRRLLWNLGGKLADMPALMILIPLFVCGLSSIGVIVKRQNLNFHAPFHLLYSSPNDETKIHATFNYTNPKYNAFERFTKSHSAAILKMNPGDNILTDDTIDKYLRLKQKIEAIRLKDGEKFLKYDSMCLRASHDVCARDIIETIITMDKTIKLQYPETKVPISSKNSTINLYLGDKIGGVVVDQDGYLNSAESLALYFKLAPKFEREFDKWDLEFRRLLKNENLKPMKFSWWTYGAFKQTFIDLLYSVYHNLGWCLIVMTVLSIFAFIKCNHHRSHPLLATVSALVAVCSIGSAISVDVGINGSLNPVIFPTYFIIAACVIFIATNLLESWRKYSNMQIEPKQKFRFILSWEMPGFLFICLLLFASYTLCSICTNLPLFQRTCQLLAASCVFAFVMVFFLYGGALCISGRREIAGLKWYQIWPGKTKSIPSHVYKLSEADTLHKSLLTMPSSGSCNSIEILCSGYFRYISFLVFCIYIIFAVWGCSTADISFNENHYIVSNDNLQDFLTDYKHFYGGYSNYIELVFDGVVDYFNPKVRRAISEMLSWLESDLRATDKVVSWLNDFNEFEQTIVNLINRESFVPLVNLVFLRDPRYKIYLSDIQVSLKTDQILSSRMYVRLNDAGVGRQVYIVKGLLAKAKFYDLPLKIKSPSLFLLQHDIEIQWNTISNFLILILLLCLFSLITFFQPFLTFILIFCVCSTTVGTLGYASLCGVPLNGLSVGTALAGTMYTTFICMTFCYLYNNAHESGPKQRTLYAFQSTLRGVWWSAIIAVVSYLPLLSLQCDFIVHQLKIILCQVAVSCLHCLLFLPPLLHFYSSSFIVCLQSCLKCIDGSTKRTKKKHVYYVPVSQKALLDPTYVQQFFKQKFREDIYQPTTNALTFRKPPSMLMPPPAASDHQQNNSQQKRIVVPGNDPAPKLFRYFSASMDNIDNIGHKPTGPGKKVDFDELNGWTPKVAQKSLVPMSNVVKDDSCYEYLYESVPFENNLDRRLFQQNSDKKQTPTNKLSYAKWMKEIPIDGQRTSRVIAETYTIEADLPTKLEKMLMQYDRRKQPVPLGVPSIGAPNVKERYFNNGVVFGNPMTLKTLSVSNQPYIPEAPPRSRRQTRNSSQVVHHSSKPQALQCVTQASSQYIPPVKLSTINVPDFEQNNRSLKYTLHKPPSIWH